MKKPLEQFSGRSLSKNRRNKIFDGYSWAEYRGRQMFAQGLPCPYAGNTKWIAHAIERGWRRAWMEYTKKC